MYEMLKNDIENEQVGINTCSIVCKITCSNNINAVF